MRITILCLLSIKQVLLKIMLFKMANNSNNEQVFDLLIK